MDAAGLLDVNFLDHLIISDKGFYSFADEGKMGVKKRGINTYLFFIFILVNKLNLCIHLNQSYQKSIPGRILKIHLNH
ncbi:MAG: JAB domain-containing protein [Bacteroidota bacterium]